MPFSSTIFPTSVLFCDVEIALEFGVKWLRGDCDWGVFFMCFGKNHKCCLLLIVHFKGHRQLTAADDQVLIPTWVRAQTFLTPFWPEYWKMMHDGVVARLQAFFSRKQMSTFNICCELSSWKYCRFHMEAAWVGRIFTPKRAIAAKCYCLGLVNCALWSSCESGDF